MTNQKYNELITIITPVFNAEKSIEKTILSVLREKDFSVEYIIVDGGSTDKTLNIIHKYIDKIDHLISEKDNGIADAYNKGIELAKGKLIGIVAADDQLIMSSIKNIRELYDGISDVICGNVIEFNSARNRYRRRHSDPNLNNLKIRTSLEHPASFIRKSAYKKFGVYSLDYKCAIDRELFLRFYKSGAKFQILNIDFSFFTSGGISTENPCKYAFPEDSKISIEFGTPKIIAKSYLYKAKAQYHIFSIIKRILSSLSLTSLFNNIMINRGNYITKSQILKLKLF